MRISLKRVSLPRFLRSIACSVNVVSQRPKLSNLPWTPFFCPVLGRVAPVTVFPRSILFALIVCALPGLRLAASDWPQLLGPTSDAVYAGSALSEHWPKAGPRQIWSAEIGEGYSSPVVASGRVVIAHRR